MHQRLCRSDAPTRSDDQAALHQIQKVGVILPHHLLQRHLFAHALALVAVFCGAVNCPIASIILSVELFGSGELLYFALACGISYMLSGYFGLYSSQKIMYSKLKAEFINIHAK